MNLFCASRKTFCKHWCHAKYLRALVQMKFLHVFSSFVSRISFKKNVHAIVGVPPSRDHTCVKTPIFLRIRRKFIENSPNMHILFWVPRDFHENSYKLCEPGKCHSAHPHGDHFLLNSRTFCKPFRLGEINSSFRFINPRFKHVNLCQTNYASKIHFLWNWDLINETRFHIVEQIKFF